MFDGLLGGKFSNKCKHAIKCIGSRLGPIRNKKNAMVRFLRKDVADLLADGHDDNALSRMDALTAEMNRASCYDMIEQCCQCILQQLSVLQKQRECPQEAIVSVSTLIFAAARFPDLPELCDLRRAFTDRYGSQVESSVHPEFVEKIQRKSFPLERKMRVMQEIAGEYSIHWDPKKFANNSDTHTALPDKIKKGLAITNQNDEKIVRNHGPIGLHQQLLFERRYDYISADTIQKKDLQNNPKDIHVIPSTNNEPSRRAKKVFAEETENVKPSIVVTRHPPPIDGQHRIQGFQADDLANKSTRNEDSQTFDVQQKQTHIPVQSEAHKGSYKIPPYTKSKEATNVEHVKEHFCEEEKVPVVGGRPLQSFGDKESDITTPNVKAKVISKPTFVDLTLADPTSGFTGNGRTNDGGAKHSRTEKASDMRPPYVKTKMSSKSSSNDPSLPDHQSTPGYVVNASGNGTDDANSRTRSVRKKHTIIPATNNVDSTGDSPAMILGCGHKQSSIQRQDEEYNSQKVTMASKVHIVQEADNAIYYGKLFTRTPDGRRRHHKDGRNAINYDGGDEEEMMDMLLIHYSKKGVTSGNVLVKETPRFPPGRVVSLPPEPVSPVEAVKGPARAASMQPDLLGPKIARVHPNLPDCDELAARISSLRKS